MPRYVQRWDEEQQRYRYDEVGSGPASHGASPAIHGPVDSFISPIDGSVVVGRSGIRDHCRKHGVVPAGEFTPEFYANKAKERERLHTGERTKEQVRKDRQFINEVINRYERG